MNIVRFLIHTFLGLTLVCGLQADPAAGELPRVSRRMRVIIDNDFGGDPDGLFQLAHHLLSPSVEVRAIIGSHHHPGGFYGKPGTAAHAVEMAGKLLETLHLKGRIPVIAGASQPMTDPTTPVNTEAAAFIVREAMRDDVKTPLYLVCGAGLTDTASAWLKEPAISRKLTLIWIGGPEYPGTPAPPGASRMEYNLSIDPKAAQTVFNQSDLPLWQVPRGTYRQALVSQTELRQAMHPEQNPTSRFLLDQLDDLMKRARGALGESYVLGDSPLVLLTALQSPWEPDPSSSPYQQLPAPRIDEHGRYADAPAGRKIRVYTGIDTRLMIGDFHAKLCHKPVNPAGNH